MQISRLPRSVRFGIAIAFLMLIHATLGASVVHATELRWTVLETEPPAPPASSPVAYAGQIYHVGGERGGEGKCGGVGRDTFAFNPAGQAWHRLADLPECAGVVDGSVASTNGGIFLFGGRRPGTDSPVSAIHRYAPAADRWVADVAQIPGEGRGTSLASVVAHSGAIYLFGGLTIDAEGNYRLRRESHRFDPERRTVAPIADMPRPRFAMHTGNGGAYVMGSEIWIVGGLGERLEVLPIDVYNPEKNSFETPRAAPPVVGKTARRGDVLYLFAEDLSAVYRYEPIADRWTVVPSVFNAPAGFEPTGSIPSPHMLCKTTRLQPGG